MLCHSCLLEVPDFTDKRSSRYNGKAFSQSPNYTAENSNDFVAKELENFG
jgi:hypothetical protein